MSSELPYLSKVEFIHLFVEAIGWVVMIVWGLLILFGVLSSFGLWLEDQREERLKKLHGD